MPETEHLADDLIAGVKAIGEFMGEDKRRTQYLIERRLIPAFKLGGRWYARRSTLRAHFDKLEAGEAA